MQPTSIIDPSWHPMMGMLYIEPLRTLNEQVLPNSSYNPERHKIFSALRTPLKDVKVVIIGQDPYPDPRLATGYAFQVPVGAKRPPSLEVIEEEVLNSDPSNMNPSGEIDLFAWADQGILLLNSALTVQRGKPGSHVKYWRPFMERLVGFISRENPCIWLMWGSSAKSFIPFIANAYEANKYGVSDIDQIPMDPKFNYVLRAPHPMVEKYGSGKFYGCNHFYKTNRILSQKRLEKIIW